jgi:hypothetical protein
MSHTSVRGQLTVTVNMTSVRFVVEWGRRSDKRQAAVHMVHSKLQLLSEVSLPYVAFPTNILILLLPEQLRMALASYKSISGPMCIYTIFIVLGHSTQPPMCVCVPT